jgi:hypothetical protein
MPQKSGQGSPSESAYEVHSPPRGVCQAAPLMRIGALTIHCPLSTVQAFPSYRLVLFIGCVAGREADGSI